MGYFTYRLFKGITLKRLQKKVEDNLALYEPSAIGRNVTAVLFQGNGCSAMQFGYQKHEESVFLPIGYQFGGIWMDVRFQDGDYWDLTIYESTEHRCSHSVNPWAEGQRVKYVQEHIDYRIKRVCELWPDQAKQIRRYLLPWRQPVSKLGRTRFVPRKGKAHPSDSHEYGDAYQIFDFVRAFGLDENSPSVTVGEQA